MKKHLSKIISVLMSMVIVMSLFSGISVTATNQQAVYYVAPGGEGDGRTEDTAASGVTIAVQSIIDDVYGVGDEVTIYVKGGEGATSMPAGGLAKNFMTSWPSGATAANITITSMPDAEAPATLGFGYHLIAMGNTTYKNITLLNDSNDDYFISANSYNVTFDEDVTFKKGTSYFSSYSPQIFTGNVWNDGKSGQGDQTVIINNTTGKKSYSLYYGVFGSKTQSPKGSQTVIVNGGSINALYLSGFNGDNGIATYGGDVNLVLNGTTVKSAAVSSSSHYPTFNGAIQIVANNGAVLPNMSTITSYASQNNIPCYIMDAGATNGGSVEMTETAGSYIIDSDYAYTYAYDSLNNPKVIYYYSTETVTLEESGNYKIGFVNDLTAIPERDSNEWIDNGNGTITRGLKVGYYYVAPGGEGDGRTEDTAASDVAIAVQSIIDDGYVEGDEAIIYVKGGEGATSMPSGGLAKNFMTSWPSGTADANITITSMPDAEAPATLGFGYHLIAMGNTTYKNITLLNDSNEDYFISANSYNVTFDEDVTFKKGTSSFSSYSPKIYTGNVWNDGKAGSATQTTLTINNTTGNKSYSLYYGVFGSKTQAPKGSQTVIVNGGTIKNLYLNSFNGEVVYSGDVNLVLNGATLNSVELSTEEQKPTINGTVQIIANKGATLPDMSAIVKYAIQNNIPYYVINSSASNDGSISISETSGNYNVESERAYAYAYDSVNQPDIIYYATDVLRLEKAGTYVVGYVDNLMDATDGLSGEWYANNDGTITKGFRKAAYYVAPNGTGTGRSEEDAAAGITVALQSIINDGYGANDEVTIYVKGGEGATSMPSDGLAKNYASDWPKVGGKDATTEATVTITSMPDAEAPATLDYGSSLHFVVLANTIFKNITLHATTSGIEHIYTNGYNVTFEEDVTFKKGTTFVDNDLNIYTGSYDGFGVRNDNAGTLTINNTSNNKKYSVFFGGSATDSKSRYMAGTKTIVINGGKVGGAYLGGGTGDKVYDSNLNIVLNGAALMDIAPNAKSLVLNGAIQIVANKSSTLPSMASIESYAAEKNIPFYFINTGTGEPNAVMTTDKVGEYKVLDGYTAFATNDSDSSKTYVSKNQILTVPAGKYSVECNETGSVKVNGDLDADGKVTGSDLVCMKKAILSEQIIVSADVNGDGEFNILDMIRMKQYLLGYDVVLEDSKIDPNIYSLSNTYYALNQEKKLTIGYIGGSITLGVSAEDNITDEKGNVISGDIMLSWANRTTTWFEENYPEAVIEHVNAGISDTATNFGLYRLEKDLMNTNGHDMPDLVFVEFTSNDWIYQNMPEGTQTHEDIERQIESLVRNIYGLNPYADIVFVFSARRETSDSRPDYVRVAEHYGIQCIDMGIPMQALMTERGAEQESKGSYYYTVDNLHPSTIGYGIYFEQIKAILERRLTGNAYYLAEKVNRLENVDSYMNDTLWLNPTVVSASNLSITGGNYSFSGGCSSNVFGTSRDTLSNTYITTDSVKITGSDVKVSFTFTGTTFSTIFYMGSTGINMDYTVDGGSKKNFTVDDGTAFSFQKYGHTQIFVIEQDLDYGDHTIELTFNPATNGSINVCLGGIGYAGGIVE